MFGNEIRDGTASVFAVPTSAVGSVSTVGLVTLFEFTLVPEPRAYVLLLFGAGALWLGRVRTRK